NAVPLYQQTANLKQTIEEKLGLPRKPKRPLTPYFRFMAEVRPTILKKNPHLKATGNILELYHIFQKVLKKKKELGKPKRPISPYLMFLADNKEKRGDQAFADWQLSMSKEWDKLSEEKKSEYLNKYKKLIEGYRREMQIWEEKMIRLGHIDLVRNEALIEPKEHTTKAPRRLKKKEE
ncbi:hypothetical protein C0J52_01675, partial [Blattella germanica]